MLCVCLCATVAEKILSRRELRLRNCDLTPARLSRCDWDGVTIAVHGNTDDEFLRYRLEDEEICGVGGTVVSVEKHSDHIAVQFNSNGGA